MFSGSPNLKDMSKEYIKEKIVKIIGESSGYEEGEISKVSNLISDEIIDSLGMIELISLLEKEFNVIFSEDDLVLENFETLNKIIDLIELKISKK